jgi:hypothetical protein
MTRYVIIRVHCFLVIGLSALFANSNELGQDGDGEKYPFVAQEVGNSFRHNMCLGLAGAIECLEQGTEVQGVESSVDLAARVYKELTESDNEFVYKSTLLLRNESKVPICSKAALDELGFLIQDEYVNTVKTKLLHEQVDNPDPDTPEGRAVLESRKKYVDLLQQSRNKITSKKELKDLFTVGQEDGLVALAAWGVRFFEKGPPQTIIDKHQLQIDPATGAYPWVPSAHSFLLTYDEEEDQIYVFDSDDPDGKWPVTVEGYGSSLRIRWRIDDHMGNGPSHQSYDNVQLLATFLADLSDIVDGDNSDSTSDPTKTNEP